jgi:hypothetical protein
MLMGQLPGGLPVTSLNGNAGAQRYITQPLPPYTLPQPVARAPIVSVPPTPPVPTLPAGIEAWRTQMLALNPFYLSQRFGMPAAQVKQLLADPQAAIMLYQQARGQGSQQLGVNRPGGGSGYGNVDTPESRQRLGDQLRAGFSDNPMGLVDAIRNAIGLATDPVGTLMGTAADAVLGLDQGTLGLHGVRGYRPYSDEVIRAARAGTIKSRAAADKMQAEIDGARAKAMSDRATRAHAGAGGRGVAGGANRGSSSAGPGNRGPRGGGAYGGTGGVGSYGV